MKRICCAIGLRAARWGQRALPGLFSARWGCRALPVLICLFSLVLEARTVAVDTVAANPGATVSVGVTVDSLEDAGAAVVVVGYDPTVVVSLGCDAGEAADERKMTYVDTGSGRIVAVFSGFKDGTGGELMRIRFSVRDGTQGLFSDVTLHDVQFGAKDGVSDLSVGNPLTVKSGMIRSIAADAALSRLEEPFTVWQKTSLKALALAAGDGIQAADDASPIVVSGSVDASGEIRVAEPIFGWQTGRYALLSTPSEGLSFVFEGLTNEVAVISESANGVVTYYADVVVEGALEIVAEEGTLDAAAKARLNAQLMGLLSEYPGVSRVVVRGEVALASLIADLGIVPSLAISGSEATAEYLKPGLKITAFDPKTGQVRIKVTPGDGNEIRSALATGCVHVYGTDTLGEKMKYLSGTAFDLTPYLETDSLGEADLTVALGTATFIKVKIESTTKNEGDTE